KIAPIVCLLLVSLGELTHLKSGFYHLVLSLLSTMPPRKDTSNDDQPTSFQYQLNALTAKVDAILNRMATQTPPPPPPPPPPHNQPRPPKILLPNFDGSNPLDWIFQANNYFEYYSIPTAQRVTISVFYFIGDALSYWTLIDQDMVATVSEFFRQVLYLGVLLGLTLFENLILCLVKHSFPRLFALECDKHVTVYDKLSDPSLIASFRRAPRGGIEEAHLHLLAEKAATIILTNISGSEIDIPSILCPICNIAEESSSHLLFNCHVARVLLSKVTRCKNKYDLWRLQMECLLKSQRMVGYIDGQFPGNGKEKVGDIDAIASDSLVKGWILGSISEEAARKVVNHLTHMQKKIDFTAKDLWDELQRSYGPSVREQDLSRFNMNCKR
nr:ankyrin repeat-containing domain, PGG domain protein [Tanacetum cinerariifolium]